jgi:phage terminase large subunit-like protein
LQTQAIQKAQQRIDLRIAALEYRRAHRREFVAPWYPWQQEFFRATATHSQVMVLAGNRTGKTLSAGYCFAVNATGDYPEGWEGRRLRNAGTHWALGVDARQVRDVLQKELIGDLLDGDKITGGWIHPGEVVRIARSQSPGLASDIWVRHVDGGDSRISLRSYTQAGTGQATLPFAGSSVDQILVDEQPGDEIVGQLVTRTMTGDHGRGGLMIYSMTPEKGLTQLVQNFMERRGPQQALIGPIAWSDCPHLTPAVQETILASIPEHERDMRSKGVPFFGSGLVFPIAEDRIKCEPFEVSKRPWLRVLRAVDLGIDHPCATAWLAYDPEADVMYLTRTHSRSGSIVAEHAAVTNSQWDHSPCVFPHDADNREKGSGQTVRMLYEQNGIRNALDFSNPDGSIYVEPGIQALYEWMRTDKFKVFSTCKEFFDEFRKYHRDEGKIVKLDDDVISATRYGAQMVKRYGVSPTAQTLVPQAVGGAFRF